MDILLIIVAGVFLIAGFCGCVLPVIPGVPLSYAGILLLHFSTRYEFTTGFLILWALLVILVQVLDWVIPVWGTKKFGGSKKGIWGCTVGMMIGIFLGPWGIILGPFVGAVVGELLAGKASYSAIKAGFGSFIGFLLGAISKLIVAGFLIYYYTKTIFEF